MASVNTVRPPNTRWYNSWRFWLGGAVSLALVVWAVWSLDWQQVWRALGDARPGWVALAIVSAARVLRWRGLLSPQRFGAGALLTTLLAGQVVNYVVPARLGDVVRAVALGQESGTSKARVLGTVALEKLWDVAMLLMLAAGLSVGLVLPGWLVLPARLLAAGSVIGLALLLSALLFRSHLSFVTGHWSLSVGHWSLSIGHCPLSIGHWLSALLDGLEGIIRPQALFWGLLGSMVVWGIGAATNYCVLYAFDLPSSAAPVLLLLAALQAGVAVPSLPGSLGIFEGICIAVLALFGVGQEEALAAGLVLHAVVFAPPLVLGGALMWRAGYGQGKQSDFRDSETSGGGLRNAQHATRNTQPPTSNFQLPTSNLQPPTSNLQPPTSNLQSPTSLSIVIPVYNGAETLPGCLQALLAQTLPADQCEVIVVDDGSTDNTAEVARGFGVRVISQPNAGPAAARNRGAEAAQGDILLFTDADCIPAPDWASRMAAAFTGPGGSAELAEVVVGAKGVYRTRQQELVARFVQAEYEDRYDRMRVLEAIDFVDTYSAGYRRDVFLASGGFDTSFPTASVEDQEFSFRLTETGHRLVFVPDAQVFHIHDHTLGEYARRKFWIGYWKVRVMREHPDKLVRDSHTPQVLKLQMGLAALGALLAVGGILSWWLQLAGLVAWAALLLSGLPFLIKLLRRDPAVMLVAPLLLFVRAWALGLGFLVGLLTMNNGTMNR